jgi:guanylate kinase
MAYLEYSFDSAIKFGGWVVAAVSLLYTLYRNHVSDKRLNRAELAQKNAENTLREIELRGKAPYFVPSSEFFNNLYEQGDDGNTYVWLGGSGNVLCALRKQVSEDITDGKTVILALENHGAAARRIRIETELKNCVLRQEPDFDSAAHRIFLKYEYEHALHGRSVELRISFESSDGFQGTHVYRTVHGEFVFERIHPG